MTANQDIEVFWKQQSGTIRQFLTDHPSHEQLSSEIAYILRKRVKKADIECSAVTHRAKTLNSFQDKLSRKHIKDPFTEIDDLAGVRIVYLYKNDFDKIAKIINEEFKILETVDKLAEQDPDRFGYDAVHYIVQLGRKSKGARYDDLKEFRCEIQVRTVLQDAWAIVSHHLVYKREGDIPNHLKRKLFQLSGLFGTADDQFDSIHAEREKYVEKVEKSSTTEDGFLALEINVDTVAALLKIRLPEGKYEINTTGISRHLADIDKERYSTLWDIDNVLRRTKRAMKKFEKELGLSLTGAGFLSGSLAMIDKDYRLKSEVMVVGVDAYNKSKHLVED